MNKIEQIAQLLREKLYGNRNKIDSGCFTIHVNPFGEKYIVENGVLKIDGWQTIISIEFMGYDFGDLNRHHEVGNFNTLDEGLDALKKLIKTTEVNKEF